MRGIHRSSFVAGVAAFVLVPSLSAMALTPAEVRYGCHVSNQFVMVNFPIEPAIASTEVVRASAVFGPSQTLVGSVLTLRSGKRYFADIATQQPRSRESYELLRALGIRDPEEAFAGTFWPTVKPIPRRFTTVSCT